MSDIKTLVKALKLASHNYYESDKPSMTDEEYDMLREKLYELDPANSFFNDVGSLPEKGRVNLPYPMPSLCK